MDIESRFFYDTPKFITNLKHKPEPPTESCWNCHKTEVCFKPSVAENFKMLGIRNTELVSSQIPLCYECGIEFMSSFIDASGHQIPKYRDDGMPFDDGDIAKSYDEITQNTGIQSKH